MKIGYHASHEQFSPSQLLHYVKLAEKAGFQAVLSSDHFHPWSDQQTQSGFAWSWLGAAMSVTSLEFGIVNAPGQRYHPAIIAQAVATLDEMFPDRFWLAAGSGQALNEKITGDIWPSKEIRHQRLQECVQIMRRLWAGELVNFHGTVTVENALLYTRPTASIDVLGAALSISTAEWTGNWADGLITVNQDHETLEKIIKAFRQVNSNGTLALKLHVSYAETPEEALQSALENWRNNTLGEKIQAELSRPELYDEAGRHVTADHVRKQVLVSSDPADYIERIHAYQQMGFNRIFLHNVNRQQEKFISFMELDVLNRL